MLLRFTPKGLLTFLACALVGFGAEAAQISKVDGAKIFVDFAEGEDIQPGGRFLVVVGGKKKAVIEIVRVKGTKALAKNLKGKPEVGGQLNPLSSAAKSASASSAPTTTSRRSRRESTGGMFGDMTYGALAGYDMSTQEVTSSGTSVSMTGSGFSLKGFADLPIAGSLGLIGRGGITQFNVTGSVSGTSYKTEIMYAVADLLLRYNFGEDGFVPFALGGLGLHFPLSKSSNVLDVQRVSATTVFFAGGGFHYALSDSSYVTVTAEYGMFPPSNDVKTSMISARAGMGFRF